MDSELNILNAAYQKIRELTDFEPEVAMVLGSGLGSIAELGETVCIVEYENIEGFPISTTRCHNGKLVFCVIEGVKVVIAQGRAHLYEGYTPEEVVRPVRVLSMLGADKLILTNAAGAINTDFHAGNSVLLTDHISLFVPSPIKGSIRLNFGTKTDFPDMAKVYDSEMLKIFENEGVAVGVSFKKGVYVQITGAQYETPAEIRALKTLGADVVGMSTVVEAMAARHAGMRVCAISNITNMATGIETHELSHGEVVEVASSAADRLKLVLPRVLKRISERKA